MFPERFPLFMGLPSAQLAAVREAHGHLFDPRWWRDLQDRFRRGDYPDSPPYGTETRLA